MHDDEVGDRVENLHPVTVGLPHARKEACILERDGGVASNGMEELLVSGGKRFRAIRQAQNTHQVVGCTL